jgi:hypothetical protein
VVLGCWTKSAGPELAPNADPNIGPVLLDIDTWGPGVLSLLDEDGSAGRGMESPAGPLSEAVDDVEGRCSWR